MNVLLRRFWQFAAIAVVGAAYLLLGYLGFREYAVSRDLVWTPWDLLYADLQLMGMQLGDISGPLPWKLEVARFLAPVVPLGTVAKALAALFRTQLRHTRLLWIRGHVVVCCVGRQGLQLVRSLAKAGRSAVAVISGDDGEVAQACRESGALVVVGDPTDPAVLRRAALLRASSLVAMGDSDAVNLNVITTAHAEVSQSGSRVPVGPVLHARVDDIHLCTWLWRSHSSAVSESTPRLRLFNPHLNGARALLRDEPLDSGGIAPDDPQTARLIIAGFGRFGEALAVQSARIGHFANGRNVRITVVDTEATMRSEVFFGRYPEFRRTCDIEFIDGDIGSSAVLTALRDLVDNGDEITTVVVTLGDESSGLACALSLSSWLSGLGVRVIARVSGAEGGPAELSSRTGYGAEGYTVRAFDLLRESSNEKSVLGEELDVMARAVHEHYLERHDVMKTDDGRGNASWDGLPSGLRDTNRQQADHTPIKLRAIGCDVIPVEVGSGGSFTFSESEVEVLARMEHARWLASMYLEGYRHGPNRDNVLCTHPCIIPWGDLDEDTKELDRVAVRSIPDVLARVGLQAHRRE